MISAAEARKQSEIPDAAIDAYIESHIEPNVIAAVREGKQFCFVSCGTMPSKNQITLNTKEQKIISKLQSLGYQVSVAKSGSPWVGDSGYDVVVVGFKIYW